MLCSSGIYTRLVVGLLELGAGIVDEGLREEVVEGRVAARVQLLQVRWSCINGCLVRLQERRLVSRACTRAAAGAAASAALPGSDDSGAGCVFQQFRNCNVIVRSSVLTYIPTQYVVAYSCVMMTSKAERAHYSAHRAASARASWVPSGRESRPDARNCLC
jgi:hypothetical protein